MKVQVLKTLYWNRSVHSDAYVPGDILELPENEALSLIASNKARHAPPEAKQQEKQPEKQREQPKVQVKEELAK